jgi:hypothetical protein
MAHNSDSGNTPLHRAQWTDLPASESRPARGFVEVQALPKSFRRACDSFPSMTRSRDRADEEHQRPGKPKGENAWHEG